MQTTSDKKGNLVAPKAYLDIVAHIKRLNKAPRCPEQTRRVDLGGSALPRIPVHDLFGQSNLQRA